MARVSLVALRDHARSGAVYGCIHRTDVVLLRRRGGRRPGRARGRGALRPRPVGGSGPSGRPPRARAAPRGPAASRRRRDRDLGAGPGRPVATHGNRAPSRATERAPGPWVTPGPLGAPGVSSGTRRGGAAAPRRAAP